MSAATHTSLCDCPRCAGPERTKVTPGPGAMKWGGFTPWADDDPRMIAARAKVACPDCGGPLEAFGGEHSDRQNCPLCSDDEVTQ